MDPRAIGANAGRRYSLFANSRGIARSNPRLSSIGEKDGSDSSQNNQRHNSDNSENNDRPKLINFAKSSNNINDADTELKASRQVISLLQREIELIRMEKDGLEKLIASQTNPLSSFKENSNIESVSKNNDNINLEDSEEVNIDGSQIDVNSEQCKSLQLIKTQLYAKDEEIIKLRFSQKELQNEKEHLSLMVHALEEDKNRLKTDNSHLSEQLNMRVKTITPQSGEQFNTPDSKPQGRRMSYAAGALNSVANLAQKQKSSKLMEETMKEQNELLVAQVLELSEKCSLSEKREMETRSQCLEWEAKCCQIQSKLLTLLKEIEQTSKPTATSSIENKAANRSSDVINSESVKTLIKRLLEDKSLDIPLSWKEGNKKKSKEIKPKKFECDELGFYRSDNESENEAIIKMKPTIYGSSSVIVIENSNELINDDQDTNHYNSIDMMKNEQNRWRRRWDAFIKDIDNVDLARSKEFKSLLRDGIPQDYRCKVWKSIIDLKVGSERAAKGQNYFQELIDSKPLHGGEKSINPASKQIELDLLRTLPNNKHFESLDSSGTVRLRRVLIAYAKRNPRVGYCQGMNRLAAVALLILPEIEAFWCLVAIIEHIMPANYYTDLWMAQIDSTVVMDFVAMKLSRLNEHFERNQIDLSLFAWFLTIFVDGTPPRLYLRLWDSFLFEGDKVLFRVALAILKTTEPQLLELKNSIAINNYLRSSVTKLMDIDTFFDVVFNWTNPLSSKSVKSKRLYNRQLMRYGTQNDSEDDTSRNSDCNKSSMSPFEDSSIISV